LFQTIKIKSKLVLSRTIKRKVARSKHISSTLNVIKIAKYCSNKRNGGFIKPRKNLMMFAIPINETNAKSVISFGSDFSWLRNIPSHIKLELAAFEKTTHRLRPNSVVGAIQYIIIHKYE